MLKKSQNQSEWSLGYLYSKLFLYLWNLVFYYINLFVDGGRRIFNWLITTASPEDSAIKVNESLIRAVMWANLKIREVEKNQEE